MVSVMVFSCKGLPGSTTFRVVTEERLSFVGVDNLVVAIEVGLSAEDVLPPVAYSWVYAWIFILFVPPSKEVSVRKTIID
jgi:hypothetical protein